MKKLAIMVAFALLCTGCSKPPKDLKSPCVGAQNSPCDWRPVNAWWQS